MNDRLDQGQKLKDAAYAIYADIGNKTQEAKKLWQKGHLLSQEWIIKTGREVHQAKHFCPEPNRQWPPPGQFWFDVMLNARLITCPDCRKTIPATRVYTQSRVDSLSNLC